MLNTAAKALQTKTPSAGFRPHGIWPRALATLDPGDARSPAMQKNLNLKVKYRESSVHLRPHHLRDWFDLDVDSRTAAGRARSERHLRKMSNEEQALFGIDKLKSAVCHSGSHSARIQTGIERPTRSIMISSAAFTA